MAQACRFVCIACAYEIEAWDDGNPYFYDAEGKKQYAYHPHPDRELCLGNDVPHLCVNCGTRTKVDSLKPCAQCHECGKEQLVAEWDLDGQRCPYCRDGRFKRDPRYILIS